MIWTITRPQVAGWYWTRVNGTYEIVQVVHSEAAPTTLSALLPPKGEGGDGDTVPIDRLDVEWYGPLEIPT